MGQLTKLILVIMIAGCAQHMCLGQIQLDEELFSLFETNDHAKPDFKAPIKDATNDISTIVSVSFLFYKSFISSQDNPSCVFTPSCSEYTVLSIQQSGFIHGWLQTFDRLTRCHGLVNHHHYPFDIEKKRYYDPVQ